MAQEDPKWPSEEEDFDAVSDGKPVAAATGTTSVKIITQDEPAEPAESAETAAPAEAPDTPAVDSSDEPAEAEQVDNQAEAAAVPEVAPAADPVEESPAPVATTSSSKSMGRTILEVILFLAVVGLALWSWTLYSDNKDLKKQVSQLNANPQSVIQKQTEGLISQVSKLIDLPKGETPTIANVSDAAQAKQQSAFFNNAQNGDKVLMYVKAGEAILYRPSTNKIILVAPLTFTNNSPAATTPKTSSTSTR